MTDPTSPLAALRAMTDPQARELRASMLSAGQLPPPPEACHLSAAQARPAAQALRDALAGYAVAWGRAAPPGSATLHFSNGLLYAGAMLASCERAEPDPLNVLAIFATWAASFARDVLSESGFTEREIDAALDAPALPPEQFARLPHDMARGGAAAALLAFHAALSVVAGGDAEGLHPLFVIAGHLVAGPDAPVPRPGKGMKA